MECGVRKHKKRVLKQQRSASASHGTMCACLPAAAACLQIVFSSTLLHGNFMTIEHRRYMAMRVVEEANRCAVHMTGQGGWCRHFWQTEGSTAV